MDEDDQGSVSFLLRGSSKFDSIKKETLKVSLTAFIGSRSVSHVKVYRILYALSVRTRLQCSAFSFLQHFSPPARTRRSTHHTLPDRKLRPQQGGTDIRTEIR